MSNRAIKFRVWNKYENKFHYPSVNSYPLFAIGINGQICSSDGNGEFGTDDSNAYVIHRFTGLFDKNNKEIYEGDVLLYKGKVSNEQIVVEYGQYNCGCCDYIYGFTCGQSRLEEKEIIGNIFETPNLLNAK